MRNQLKDLQTCLPDYLVYGEPRENDHNPLYNPIFIRNLKRLDVTKSGTFWLSLTPENFHHVFSRLRNHGFVPG